MTPISVITICKNAVRTIERAIRSVVSCSYPQLEYVVVDGQSTDGTLEVVQKYRDRITTLISEPDRGISDALNKAITLTTSRYHILVHADDILLPSGLRTLAAAAESSPGADVICGRVEVMCADVKVRDFIPEPAKLTRKMSVPHMGALVRKDAWQLAGGYDARRRVAMDHLLMLRILLRHGVGAFHVVDEVVARYSLGGVSDRLALQGFRELRDNLIEEGCGRFAANTAYCTLFLKSRIARGMGIG
jgi:glycosyltransferase involved in cell wall biosynthesis